MNKKYLDPKILAEYVEALCEKNNHPDTLKQALLNQIGVLRQRYGNEIPKDDFLTLMAQQQNALKTGFRKQPVDILEWLHPPHRIPRSGMVRLVGRNSDKGYQGMKIKIDKQGLLWIERAGKMKSQICPYDVDWARCGDWCPLFNDSQPGTLELCRVYYDLDLETIDERGGE